jgi:hypothetical protein
MGDVGGNLPVLKPKKLRIVSAKPANPDAVLFDQGCFNMDFKLEDQNSMVQLKSTYLLSNFFFWVVLEIIFRGQKKYAEGQ